MCMQLHYFVALVPKTIHFINNVLDLLKSVQFILVQKSNKYPLILYFQIVN